MSYSVSFEYGDPHLRVRVSGELTAANLRAYLRDVYEECARTGRSTVLIEEDLEGPPLRPIEVYRVIVQASAETAPVVQKIAYVNLQAQAVERSVDLAMEVATDLGVNVRAFTDASAALSWLVSDDVARSSRRPLVDRRPGI